MRVPNGDSELVQIIDAALADAARRAGEWLVCRPGCTPCCHGAFAINALDAARLQAGMETLRQTDPALADEIERRAKSWIEGHGGDFPGDPATGRLGESTKSGNGSRSSPTNQPAPRWTRRPAAAMCTLLDP